MLFPHQLVKVSNKETFDCYT